MRNYSFIDQAIINFNTALQTMGGGVTSSTRPSPAADLSEPTLSEEERRHAASLMRVNHVGEVCAQALYQGQALTARSSHIQSKLVQASREETDHLIWCQQRIAELNSHTSYLNPLWYGGSLLIGVAAGLLGDKFNLGFLAETENQVERHLTGHLTRLPANDEKSKKIVEQMRLDEINHATTAKQAGAAEVPALVKSLMQITAKMMTTISYWM